MGTIGQDIRYSMRMLTRTPVVTAVAIFSLALGIGANTAIFSLMNALILRSLPIANPAQFVRLSTTTPDDPDRDGSLSLAMYQQIRKDQRVFSDLFAWTGEGIVNIEANGVKYAAGMSTVTGEYFATLGIQPLLGRWITPDDLSLESGSPAAVAVIHHGCWQRRFNGDLAVIGKTIRVEDRPLTIIGVAPENFSGLVIDAAPDVTVPIGYSGRTTYRDRKSLGLDVFARLKPGISIEQAEAQMKSVWPAILQASLPETYTGTQQQAFLDRRVEVASASTGNSFLRKKYARPLSVLMAMVGLLLLITCANLAGLMLARATERRQEFGIRFALGAGKWRVVRQVLVESLMISVIGAIIGLLFAQWTSRLLLTTIWTGLVPLAIDAAPDLRVLSFTALISLLTGVIFGISPSWSVSRIDPVNVLQKNARTHHGMSTVLSKALISTQIALSLVLVIGAVIFVRSLQNLRSTDVGFNRDGILLIHLFPKTGSENQRMPNRASYYQELADRLRGIHGVESVSYSHMGPVLSYEYTQPASVPSRQARPISAVFEAVGPGFFHLAGMRLLAGREFDWRDHDASQPVSIISESLSHRLFPKENPIGKRIDFGSHKGLEIVGVVNSASLWMPQSREPMAVYLALIQLPTYNSSSIDIRTVGDSARVLPAARHVLESFGRHFVLRAENLDQRSSNFLMTDRVLAMLSSFLGGLALLLASIGLYGLMSFWVVRRTSEIGLRMALGALPVRVQALILREALWLLLAGMTVGIPVALACERLISSMVYRTAGHDPLTILLAISILLVVAAFASYLPARRASRIDPMTALRSE